MEQMFREMDANHDGSIGFEEFVAAMKNNLSEEQLASAEGIKLGAQTQTRFQKPSDSTATLSRGGCVCRLTDDA